jgi:hypothetical protein
MTPALTAPRSQLLGTQSGVQPGDGEDAALGEASGDAEAIRVFMTLAEVAEKSSVPIAEILVRLKLPPNTAPSERAGWLLRTHSLDMSALRQAVGQDDSAE